MDRPWIYDAFLTRDRLWVYYLWTCHTFTAGMTWILFSSSAAVSFLSFPKEHSKLSQLQLLHLFVVKHIVARGVSLFLLEDEASSGISFWCGVSDRPKAGGDFTSPAGASHVCFKTGVLYRPAERPAARWTSSMFRETCYLLIDQSTVSACQSFSVWKPPSHIHSEENKITSAPDPLPSCSLETS